MKIHGAIISPNVRKVIIACMLKEVDFESNLIIPGPDLKKPEYLKINPLGQIPALEDGKLVVGDSNVILQYLDEKYPDVPLLPTDLKQRAQSRWLAEYAGAALFPCCGTMFREVMVNPLYFKEPTNQEVVNHTLEQQFPPVLDYLEKQMPDEDFLFGEGLTMADISIISMLITASYGNYNVDAARWPKLAAYTDRGMSHPVINKCIENEKAMLKMISG